MISIFLIATARAALAERRAHYASVDARCMFVASRAFIDSFASAIAARIPRWALAAIGPATPKRAGMMEAVMDACFVRTTATWLAAIFVSSLFVTAATSVARII